MVKFITTKYWLWIDAGSSTESILYGSGRAVGKSEILIHTEKTVGRSDGHLACPVFSIEDAVGGTGMILTIELKVSKS